MKISIITTSLNSEKTIENTIKSVLSQNYSNIEYIVVDGGSTDKTLEIVKKYENKIIKIISEKDNGLYDAMNKGIKLATGDIISILNSDDFFNNDKVLSVIAESFKDEKIDAVYGDISYFSDDISKVTRYWHVGEYSEKKLSNGWIVPHPALFLRKVVYDKCSYFNIDFKIAADYEFILRLLKIYHIKVKYIPIILVRMYNGGISASSLHQRINGWKELKRAWIVNNLKIPLFFIFRRIFFKLSQFF
ncbi:MAG: glycosyltransferase family 2 protein [Candidatus Nomurabacteria bacterium]|nr:glycosyltransferase family 2 protein [Candidatus Nomurabacteria bacterium]